jgi:hypothetical protein
MLEFHGDRPAQDEDQNKLLDQVHGKNNNSTQKADQHEPTEDHNHAKVDNPRSFKRQRKPPTSRKKDFLWYMTTKD